MANMPNVCVWQLYVEYVVKNPVCGLDQPIETELFKQKVDEYIRALPIFSTKVAQAE